MNLYDHSDYKSYLNEYFQESQGRGRRAKAARAIGCSASYFSQVLHGKPDLTPEQGYLLAEHLGLDEDDKNYFLLMLQEARATHYKLKSHLKKQISEKRRTRFDLKKRLKATQSLSEKSKQTYYSAWFYSAIYVALFIPKY